MPSPTERPLLSQRADGLLWELHRYAQDRAELEPAATHLGADPYRHDTRMRRLVRRIHTDRLLRRHA